MKTTRHKLHKKRVGLKLAKRTVSNEKRSEGMSRAQVWSIDVLLSVVIFISIMIIFYVTINKHNSPCITDLQSEANFLKTELEKNSEYAFISEGVVNSTLLDQFAQDVEANYDQIKSELGIRGDFCIYFEDQNGNLVLLSGNKTGIGRAAVNISGTACGEQVQ